MIVRVCRSEFGTWYFSSDGAGRFDLRPPEGTCYFASDSYAAIREASRLGPVSNEWVEARELRTVFPPPGRLADTTDTSAGRFGITLELVTLTPYTLPQQWAAAFRAAGFDGLLHLLRHDQRGIASGISLFGAAGGADRHDGDGEPLAADVVRAAGVSVFDRPHSSVLRTID